jgi:uncharacterized membrane-anchored protein
MDLDHPPGIPRLLPPDAPDRQSLVDETHARPPVPVPVPAVLTCIVALHEPAAGDERAHLATLEDARVVAEEPGFLRATLGAAVLQWERHTEFSRYTMVQPVRQAALMGADTPSLAAAVPVPPAWIREIPGRTVVALQICLLDSEGQGDATAVAIARAFLGVQRIAASRLAGGSARLFADFRLRGDGFMRALVLCESLDEDSAGRIAAQLAELEIYRVMALRAFQPARALGAALARNEAALAAISRAFQDGAREDMALLDDLLGVATEVETLIAQNTVRFSAANAYHGIVRQRFSELDESPIDGCVPAFAFLRRRLVPAMATVEATALRLAGLSERTSRSSALLRTRVDIRNEAQSQDLLRSLARGQKLQVRLQTTVEGLSVAAISYYVVGLIGYATKSLAASGMPLPINADLAMGASIPVVVLLVWWVTKRARRLLHEEAGTP